MSVIVSTVIVQARMHKLIPVKMSMFGLCTENIFMHVDGWSLEYTCSIYTDMRTRKRLNIIWMQKQYISVFNGICVCVHFQNTRNISMIDYARKTWICTQLGRNQQKCRRFDIFWIFWIPTLLTNKFMLANYFHA